MSNIRAILALALALVAVAASTNVHAQTYSVLSNFLVQPGWICSKVRRQRAS
jgi:hypothetical protein